MIVSAPKRGMSDGKAASQSYSLRYGSGRARPTPDSPVRRTAAKPERLRDGFYPSRADFRFVCLRLRAALAVRKAKDARYPGAALRISLRNLAHVESDVFLRSPCL